MKIKYRKMSLLSNNSKIHAIFYKNFIDLKFASKSCKFSHAGLATINSVNVNTRCGLLTYKNAKERKKPSFKWRDGLVIRLENFQISIFKAKSKFFTFLYFQIKSKNLKNKTGLAFYTLNWNSKDLLTFVSCFHYTISAL